MKKSFLIRVLLVLLILFITAFYGCSKNDSVTGDNGSDGDNNGGISDTRDAYDTVIDFAIAKQIMIYDYISIMTDDYSSEFMENDLTYEQIDELFSAMYGLVEYETDVENALAIIESEAVGKPAQAMRVEGLGNSMRKFFTWASGSGVRSRDRILTVASNMSESQRTQLYDWVKPEYKATVTSESEFWQKLQDGDFDNQSPVIFNDLYHVADSEFGEMAVDKDLILQKIVAREGAEGVKAGAELMIEVTKLIAPSTAKGMELVEKADEYREKVTTVFTDPGKALKDEVKSRIASKIGSYLDVDGAVDGGIIGENTAAGIKAVSDLALATDDPSEIASKGLDWGVALMKKVTGDTDGSDIGIAQSSDVDIIPSTVITKASKEENINIVLPKGKWDVKTVTQEGASATVEDVDVPAGTVVEVEDPVSYGITIIPSSAEAQTGSSVSFTASVSGAIPEGVSYLWTFGDGSSPTGGNWNGIMSKTYPEAGTYTVKVQLKSADGKVLAEDTAYAVITNAADATVTQYLHTMKSVYLVFKAAYSGSDGETSRTIVIDTRNYSGDLVWNGLSFSLQYTSGETYGTISGRFADEKYKLATLDVVEHKVRSDWIYEGGFPVDLITWEYDYDILVENLPIDKASIYGINNLNKEIKGATVQNYIGTVKYTENNPDDKDTDPVSFSSVIWNSTSQIPELKVYFFE